MKGQKDITASIRQLLLNRAKSDLRPFNELLQYYAMERFLYRLSKSTYAKKFILKGALMLRVWQAAEYRSTMDIDMLGKVSNDQQSIKHQIQQILTVEVNPDGLVFDAESIQTQQITEDADYQGVRVRFKGSLGSARINMQIDIGFGDIVYPKAERSELPTMLGNPAPRLLCYSRESAIAEKFEAMVKLGILNSRMKDFYDIWMLARQFNFDGSLLAEAINLTFKQRDTVLTEVIVAFQERFVIEKQVQWSAFCKRLTQEHVPIEFSEAVLLIQRFLYPIVNSSCAGKPFTSQWVAADKWY